MLPAFAEVEDLAERIPNGISDDDQTRAQAALDDASTLVRLEAGSASDAWVTGDAVNDTLPDIIKTVTLRSALRVFVNPTEETQSTAGPYSVSRVANAYLSNAEKVMVARAVGRVSGLGVISTTRGCIETPLVGCYGDVADEYVDVDPPGEPLPFL